MFENIKITFTPSRHFSGRGFKDRNKGLWGGWAFKAADENIWFSGDGGYGNHFKEIGEKLGPFDFALWNVDSIINSGDPSIYSLMNLCKLE